MDITVLQVKESPSDGGYGAGIEYGQHSWQCAYHPDKDSLSTSLHQQNIATWDKPLSDALSSNTPATSSPVSSTIMLPNTPVAHNPF
ncbi:hypothetical protein BDQ17DRAFT_1423211 [Cyathus striatus]|nr:hypothetical protein BDQ17DRAFT_1423211 [Cyathus striatus]